ncbi:hypothetical protein LTR17_002545 [Elasticomyces elasticus]|nr:hypothetical protein LTR17_002545 [Elasticomyces elasticus]
MLTITIYATFDSNEEEGLTSHMHLTDRNGRVSREIKLLKLLHPSWVAQVAVNLLKDKERVPTIMDIRVILEVGGNGVENKYSDYTIKIIEAAAILNSANNAARRLASFDDALLDTYPTSASGIEGNAISRERARNYQLRESSLSSVYSNEDMLPRLPNSPLLSPGGAWPAYPPTSPFGSSPPPNRWIARSVPASWTSEEVISAADEGSIRVDSSDTSSNTLSN